MYLKHAIIYLLGLILLVWSIFAGISEEKGSILYGWQLWFIAPASLMMLVSSLHALYLDCRKLRN